jgi:multiple sugar transport system substrate-binding protein
MRIGTLILAIALLFGLTACGGSSGSSDANASGSNSSNSNSASSNAPNTNDATLTASNAPVTLSVADYEFSDSQWADIEKLIRNKFPSMTVKRIVHKGADGNDIESLVVAKQTPDVIFQPSSGTTTLTNLDLLPDLAPYVTKYKVDLSKIPSTIIDSAKEFSPLHQLVMLPLDLNMTLLVYNKDIFDKFGVDYPKDHMTYGDLLNLSKKLTRSVNGKTVAGYIPQNVYSETHQLSLAILDQNNKSLLDKTPGFQSVFQWNKDLYAIPGMTDVIGQNFRKAFYSEDTATITEWMTNLAVSMSQSPPTFQWGAVSQVYWDNSPGWNSMPDFHAAYITKTSQHKDEAFQLISFLSTSSEVQSLFAKQGLPPTMINEPKILQQFGVNIPAFSGQREKLIEIMQNVKYSPMRKINPWDHDTKAVINPTTEVYTNIVNGTIDVNTGLKQLSEKINAALADKPVAK